MTVVAICVLIMLSCFIFLWWRYFNVFENYFGGIFTINNFNFFFFFAITILFLLEESFLDSPAPPLSYMKRGEG